MTKGLRPLVCTAVLLTASLAAAPVLAQKSGGVLKVHHQDSPASMSIIEEATYSTVVPMMGVFNNLLRHDLAASLPKPTSGSRLGADTSAGVPVRS